MVSINRILCAIDFSDFSLDALRHGLALAQWYSAQLTLLHVYQVSQPLPVEGLPGSVPVYVDVDPNKMAEAVRRFCAPVVGPSGRTVEVIVRPGDAAREIRKEADGVPSDLLRDGGVAAADCSRGPCIEEAQADDLGRGFWTLASCSQRARSGRAIARIGQQIGDDDSRPNPLSG